MSELGREAAGIKMKKALTVGNKFYRTVSNKFAKDEDADFEYTQPIAQMIRFPSALPSFHLKVRAVFRHHPLALSCQLGAFDGVRSFTQLAECTGSVASSCSAHCATGCCALPSQVDAVRAATADDAHQCMRWAATA